MIPFDSTAVDIILTGIMLVVSAINITLLSVIVVTLWVNWRKSRPVHWAFMRKASIGMFWSMALLAVRLLSLHDAAFGSLQRLMTGFALASVAVGFFTICTSIHFALIWTKQLQTTFGKRMLLMSYAIPLLISVLLIVQPHWVVSELRVTASRNLAVDFTLVAQVLILLMVLQGAVSLLHTVRSKGRQGRLYWISDSLVIMYLVVVAVWPQINETAWSSLFILGIVTTFVYFYAQSDEINLARVAFNGLSEALEQTHALNQVSAILMQEQDSAQVLQTILNKVSAVVPSYNVALVIFNTDVTAVEHVLNGENNPINIDHLLLDMDWLKAGLAGLVMETFETIVSDGEQLDARETPTVQATRKDNNVGPLLIAPLLYKDQLTGIMSVAREIGQPNFSPADVELTEALATQLASTIFNRRAVAQTERALAQQQQARRQAELMFAVAEAGVTEGNLNRLLAKVLQLYSDSTGFQHLRLQLVDKTNALVEHEISLDAPLAQKETSTYAAYLQTLSGQCFLAQAPRMLSSAEVIALYPADSTVYGSIICAPLMHQENALGVMTVLNPVGAPDHNAADLALLVAVATQIANTVTSFNATELLRQREEQFSAIIRYAAEAITILDVDQDRIIDLNAAASELFGYPADVIRNMDPIQLYPPEGRDQAWRQRIMDHAFDTVQKTGPTIVETEFMHADGHVFLCEVRLVVLPDPKRRLLRNSLVDITERKQQEAAALQSQKLESLGIMAGGIAHDFNNLLLAMMGQAQIAQRRLPKDTAALKNIAKIESAAKRASELTRQMMAYAGKGQTVERDLVDINTLIDENVGLLRATIPDNILLDIDLADTPPTVFGERSQLQQVVMNMVLNASEAIGEDAGAIEIGTKLCTLTAAELVPWQAISPDFKGGDCVSLTFKDNGIGMDTETQQRIFDPFFSTKTSGHGLGLAGVLGMIRAHGGSVQVNSKLGQGTTFEIMFPTDQRDASQTASGSELHVDASQLSGRTILVIDDEVAVLETLTETLKSFGMQVYSATSGTDGVALFAAHQDTIEVTLADVAMPGISGVEAMRRIQQISATAKVILSSGYNRLDADKIAETEAFVSFLQKPYQTEQLLRKLYDVLHTNLAETS